MNALLKNLRNRIRAARLSQKPLSEQFMKLHPGEASEKSSDTICFFSSFDPQSRVDDYVLYFLRGIREQLRADIVFISTSEELRPAELERLKPLCRWILHRENIGHDFGSWNAGMATIPEWRASYEYLILANDSVYGPLSELSGLVAPIRRPRPAIAGMTESLEHERHLQSYFLAMNRAAFQSTFFRDFCKGFRYFKDRSLTIEMYELGLSREALRGGCELIPFVPYAGIRDFVLKEAPGSHAAAEASRRNVNPTHYFWRELITRYHAPLIKVDLLKFNPSRIPDGADAIEVVAKHSAYPVALIEGHLRRVARRGAS